MTNLEERKNKFTTLFEEYNCSTKILDAFIEIDSKNYKRVIYKLQCGLCNKVWNMSESNLYGVIKRKSHGCIQCKNKVTCFKKWTSENLNIIEELKQKFDILHLKGKRYSFYCHTCNNTFEDQMGNILQRYKNNKIICQYCKNNTNKEACLDRYYKYKLYENITFIKEVEKGKWLVKCNSCNIEYEAWIDNLVKIKKISNTNNCPKCSNKAGSSREEDGLYFYLKDELNLNVIKKIKINGKEIDCYLPEYNIGFEYNGSYWHSIDNELTNKDIYSHLDKLLYTNKDIRLITIFSFQWINKCNIVKNKILNLLKRTSQKTIRPSKYLISKITWQDAKIFLDKYHIMGHGEATSKCYGIFYQNNLIAVSTFLPQRSGHGRTDNFNIYELNRYCCSSFRCINSLKNIIKKFKEDNPGVNKIISYADLCWTDLHKNIYINNNFKFISITQPNYWWCKEDKFLTRYQTQKHKLKDLLGDNFDQTESEVNNMLRNKWKRVYDCGHAKYELKI